jgi:hypothetical protein
LYNKNSLIGKTIYIDPSILKNFTFYELKEYLLNIQLKGINDYYSKLVASYSNNIKERIKFIQAINDECNKIKFQDETLQLESKVKDVKAINNEVKRKHDIITGKLKKLEDKVKLFLETDRKVIQRKIVQKNFMEDSLRKITNIAMSIGEYKCEILKLFNRQNLGLITNCVLLAKNVEEGLMKKGKQFATMLHSDYEKLKGYENDVMQLNDKLKSN